MLPEPTAEALEPTAIVILRQLAERTEALAACLEAQESAESKELELVRESLSRAWAVLGIRIPPVYPAPAYTAMERLIVERQESRPARERLAAEAASRIARLEKGIGVLKAWAEVPRERRQAHGEALKAILGEAIALSEWAAGPLPDSDLCVCRWCGVVRLPGSPWGAHAYTCCHRTWGYSSTIQAKQLPVNFWSKNYPGERARGVELEPVLDGRGRPEMSPAT